jgi:hypothetical protein
VNNNLFGCGLSAPGKVLYKKEFQLAHREMIEAEKSFLPVN